MVALTSDPEQVLLAKIAEASGAEVSGWEAPYILWRKIVLALGGTLTGSESEQVLMAKAGILWGADVNASMFQEVILHLSLLALGGNVSGRESIQRTLFEIAYLVAGGGINPGNASAHLIVFIGESNSGGYAENTHPTLVELSPRSEVNILNNNTLSFESLDIGTNNLLGHTGLAANATHGWELGLTNTVTQSLWPAPAYLVKCGQGGSVIAEWGSGGAYWTAAAARIDAALSLIPSRTLSTVWLTLGINDAIAGTNVDSWKAAMVTWIALIRSKLGDSTRIIMPYLPADRTTFNSAINDLASADSGLMIASSTGATQRDGNHWDYFGMQSLSRRLTGKTLGQSIGEPTFAAPTWGILVSAVQVGNELRWNSAGNAGATVEAPLDSDAFVLVADYSTEASTSGIVLILDDDPAELDYAWGAGQQFKGCIFHFGGSWYTGTSYAGVASRVAVASFPCKVRAFSNGDDIFYQVSYDGGTVYATLYTHLGAMTGVESVTLKAIFALGASGQKITANLSARYVPPVNLALLTGLESYWPLGEASGTRFDSKGVNHLADNNTVTQAAGIVGNAAQFTAANTEFLSIADNASISTGDFDWTMRFLVRLDSKPTYAMVASQFAGGAWGWRLYFDQGADGFFFDIGNGASSQIGQVSTIGTATNTGQWYQLLVSHDAANDRLRIRLNSAVSAISAAMSGPGGDATAQFQIGASGGAFPFDGRIQHAAYWKRLLTDSEERALWNSGEPLILSDFH